MEGMSVGRPARILLVEDDLTLRDALVFALTDEGFDVRTASDPEEARTTLFGFEADLLVLDVRLPGRASGLDLARELKERAPVIFLTAADTIEDRLAGFDAGADDYVIKPFALAELLARLRVVLKRNAGTPESEVVVVADMEIDEGAHVVRRNGTE